MPDKKTSGGTPTSNRDMDELDEDAIEARLNELAQKSEDSLRPKGIFDEDDPLKPQSDVDEDAVTPGGDFAADDWFD